VSLRLTQYGRRELAIGSVLLAAAVALLAWAAVAVSTWLALLLVMPVSLWAWLVAFFRDPQRSTPAQPGLFISPADGRVADVTPLGPDGPLGCEAVQVGIFMNVFNVHVNRSPADGVVDRVEHQAGTFLDARDPSASSRNESATIYLTCEDAEENFPVIVRQVAGLVARRIVTDLSPGQAVGRGERIGMIKFGSRVELIVPRRRAGNVLVRVGQKVTAGLTPLIAAQEIPQ